MMKIFQFIIFLVLISSVGHRRCLPKVKELNRTIDPKHQVIKGALLATRFNSLEELKSVIQIEHFNSSPLPNNKSFVRISHFSGGQNVVSVIKPGISEHDIKKARVGGLLERINLAFNSPYFVIHRNDLLRAFTLSRRRGRIFGEGDIAFYDLAETMVYHISDEKMMEVYSQDLSEKGYINSFNHMAAQAFITSIFSERLADFIADTHERSNMPELLTGIFSEEQIADLEKGPVDNYVDVINNEWGQELGKSLREKYKINRHTVWTPHLLSEYLNDIQIYFSWAFELEFKPYKPSDELVLKFSAKINSVMKDVSALMSGMK